MPRVDSWSSLLGLNPEHSYRLPCLSTRGSELHTPVPAELIFFVRSFGATPFGRSGEWVGDPDFMRLTLNRTILPRTLPSRDGQRSGSRCREYLSHQSQFLMNRRRLEIVVLRWVLRLDYLAATRARGLR